MYCPYEDYSPVGYKAFNDHINSNAFCLNEKQKLLCQVKKKKEFHEEVAFIVLPKGYIDANQMREEDVAKPSRFHVWREAVMCTSSPKGWVVICRFGFLVIYPLPFLF